MHHTSFASSAHEVEKVELRDYYQNAMGQLDNNQKLEADQRIKEEEKQTMLQSSVRVVAGPPSATSPSNEIMRLRRASQASMFAMSVNDSKPAAQPTGSAPRCCICVIPATLRAP